MSTNTSIDNAEFEARMRVLAAALGEQQLSAASTSATPALADYHRKALGATAVAAPDTPLSLALLEALKPTIGSMGLEFVEEIYVSADLQRAISRLRAVSIRQMQTPEPDLCVVRMKSYALGIVRLPQSVLDLATAQQAAKALTD